MPYIECPECGQRALRVATRCPHCGFAFPARPLHRPLAEPRPSWLRRPIVWLGLTSLWLVVVSAIGHRSWPGPASIRPVSASRAGQASSDPGARLATVAPGPTVAADTARTAPPGPPIAATTARAPQKTELGLRRYATTWTHIRGARAMAAASVRVLDPGESVLVDSLRRGWYRVVVDGRAVGYVHQKNLDPAPPTARR